MNLIKRKLLKNLWNWNKSVRFEKYLHHEDYIQEIFQNISKDFLFHSTTIAAKIDKHVCDLNENWMLVSSPFYSSLYSKTSDLTEFNAKNKISSKEFKGEVEYDINENNKIMNINLNNKNNTLKFESMKNSNKWKSKEGDEEYEDWMWSIKTKSNNDVKRNYDTPNKTIFMADKFLNSLKDYNYLIWTNIYMKEEQLPKLKLDFDFN